MYAWYLISYCTADILVLEIAMMANSGLSHSIVIQKPYTNNPNINNNNDDDAQKKHQNDGADNNGNEISELITFER
ncbi:MAG TPA: hypothetical protein VFJ51_05490 [Nitrososphaeraceae archaeon]|nr:hypothetical protein [Nitrososphaeraceae archaeon]